MDPAMMKNLALGAFPPMLLAIVFFAAMWRKRREADGASGGTEDARRLDWRVIAAPAVLAFATVVTYVIVMGMPGIPPGSAMEWMPFVALGAGVAGAIASIERLPGFLRWPPSFAVLVAAWWVSARRPIEASWTNEQIAMELMEFVVPAMVALAAALVLTRRAGALPIVIMLVFVGSASQLLVLGFNSMRQGQVVGMTAAALVGMAGVAIWRRNLRIGPGAVVFGVVMVMTGLFQARLFGQATNEMARVYMSILIFSIVLGAMVYSGLPEKRPVLRAVLALVAMGVPLAATTGYAARPYFAEMGESEYGSASPESPAADLATPEQVGI
jgi:hypothetical protein